MEKNQISTRETQNNNLSQETNLLKRYIQTKEDIDTKQVEENNTKEKHDASGNCQQVVHVPAHMREGKRVDSYDRRCGQKHTEKEAEQKNQEEAEEIDTQEQLLKESADFVGSHEEFISHPYFDIKGNLTIGYGTVIHNKEEFISLNLQNKGVTLTKTQKEVNYEKAMSFREQYSKNISARRQNNMHLLGQISETDARLMLENYIQNTSIPNIKNVLKNDGINFDDLNISVKIALIDLDYNTGSILGFPNMRVALKNKDYETAAEETHRTVNENRNKATYNLIMKAQLN